MGTTARRAATGLAVALALIGAGGAVPASAAPDIGGHRWQYTREQTQEMADWLSDHANLTGFTLTVASMPNPQALLLFNGYTAYMRDTINEAARKDECVFVQKSPPGVGGDSVPYIGIGC